MSPDVRAHLERIDAETSETLNASILRPALRKAMETMSSVRYLAQCNGGTWFVMRSGKHWHSADDDAPTPLREFFAVVLDVNDWFRNQGGVVDHPKGFVPTTEVQITRGDVLRWVI